MEGFLDTGKVLPQMCMTWVREDQMQRKEFLQTAELIYDIFFHPLLLLTSF